VSIRETVVVEGAGPDVLDLRATLSQMTDIAGEVLGEEADQGSLRDFYLAIRLRVHHEPKHPHCFRHRDPGRG
jgi:hypothetical protein